MSSTSDSGQGHGSSGTKQKSIEELLYSAKVDVNEASVETKKSVYEPTAKHEKSGWGSYNPIRTKEEGQTLLESGYKDGKQVYNITADGIIVKFQPDNTSNHGYHAYGVTKPRDIPARVLKQMLSDGKITRTQYNQFRKGKR